MDGSCWWTHPLSFLSLCSKAVWVVASMSWWAPEALERKTKIEQMIMKLLSVKGWQINPNQSDHETQTTTPLGLCNRRKKQGWPSRSHILRLFKVPWRSRIIYYVSSLCLEIGRIGCRTQEFCEDKIQSGSVSITQEVLARVTPTVQDLLFGSERLYILFITHLQDSMAVSMQFFSPVGETVERSLAEMKWRA